MPRRRKWSRASLRERSDASTPERHAHSTASPPSTSSPLFFFSLLLLSSPLLFLPGLARATQPATCRNRGSVCRTATKAERALATHTRRRKFAVAPTTPTYCVSATPIGASVPSYAPGALCGPTRTPSISSSPTIYLGVSTSSIPPTRPSAGVNTTPDAQTAPLASSRPSFCPLSSSPTRANSAGPRSRRFMATIDTSASSL